MVGQIVAAGIPYESIAAVFVTHLHADHVSDYFPLVAFGRKIGPQPGFAGTVNVYRPGRAGAFPANALQPGVQPVNPGNPTSGTLDLHNGLLDAYAYSVNGMYIKSASGPDIRDIVDVQDIVIPTSVGANAVDLVSPEMEPFEVYKDDKVRVTAILVHHPVVFPAYAFRFDTEDGSVVLSGDTTPTPNMVKIARGADLLVHEIMNSEAMLANGISDQFVSFLRAVHTDVTEVGAIARDAGVGTLALSHIISVEPTSAYPSPVDAATWTRPIASDFSGTTIVGEDLMVLKIADSTVSRQ